MSRNKDDAYPEQEQEEEQSFIGHLLELRDRLLRIVLALLVVFIALFPFANDIYTYLAEPLLKSLPSGEKMIAVGIIDPFLIPLKLAFSAAMFLVMPYILFELWKFVAPGLYQHERKLVMPIIVSSVILFYMGVLFAYYVVFPLVFEFLANTAPAGVDVKPDIGYYLSFAITIFFAFGFAFEIPIATFALVAAGATTPEKLVAKRPYVVVGAFVVGMLLTPPDAISQTLLAIPMWILFELGVIVSRMYMRNRPAKEADDDDEEHSIMPAAAGAATVAAAATTVAGAAEGESEADEPASTDEPVESDYVPMTEEEMEAELDRIDAEMAALEDEDDDEGFDDDEDEAEPGQASDKEKKDDKS